MPAAEFHFFARMSDELSGVLDVYVNDTASNVIGAITPVATVLLTLYVILWGWAMLRGVISEPITDGLGRIIRLALITGVALQLGNYNGVLSNMLWNSPDAIASYIGGDTGTSNSNYLDRLMEQIYDFGLAFFNKAQSISTLGIPNLPLLFMAYAIWAAGVIATGYAAFLLALSKIALAVILGVGPIFVLLTLFEPTKRFFDAWIGQALNYVFLVMLSAATIKLILAVLQHYLFATVANAQADPALNQAIPALVYSIVATLVLIQLPSIASALGGGVAIGTLGAVGWAYGRAKGGAVAMRPTNLRRSMLRAQSDVRIVRDASKAVGSVPSALYRKVTGGPKNRVTKG